MWFRVGLAALSVVFPLLSFADEITLEGVIEKAVEQSRSVKIAALDVAISQTDIKAAKSDYYPTLRANINVEYLKGLQSQPQQVTSVGNTVLPYGTRFQNSVGTQFNQVLFDFGARKHKVAMSRYDAGSKTAIVDQTLRDLKSQVIEAYANALQSYKAVIANQDMLAFAQESYQCKKRLYQAGSITKVEMTDESIVVAQTLDEIQTAKEQLAQHLEKLSYYTRELYDLETLEISDLVNEANDLRDLDLKKTPEARQYDDKIAQKTEEIAYLKRQNLPQLSVYSYYNLYGVNQNSLGKSVTNLSQRTVSLGLSLGVPIFDGFKNRAAIQKAELEKQKLALQKEDALAQLDVQAKTYQEQMSNFGVQLQTKARILKRTQYKGELVTRLSEQQLVDKTKKLEANIDEVKRQLESDKIVIQSLVALKKRRLLEES
jgi:outer membrane protein